jgi:hypothetical protein
VYGVATAPLTVQQKSFPEAHLTYELKRNPTVRTHRLSLIELGCVKNLTSTPSPATRATRGRVSIFANENKSEKLGSVSDPFQMVRALIRQPITNKHFIRSYSRNQQLRFSLPCLDSVPVGLLTRLISSGRVAQTASAWVFVTLQRGCYAQQSADLNRLVLFASYFHSLLPRNREGCDPYCASQGSLRTTSLQYPNGGLLPTKTSIAWYYACWIGHVKRYLAPKI